MSSASTYYGPDSMFTSANLAAARLSALENHECFRQSKQATESSSFNGETLGKGRSSKKQLGSALSSVAALISKLDEEQPTQWESRSAPTLQLRAIKRPDETLSIFLKKVEAARISREGTSSALSGSANLTGTSSSADTTLLQPLWQDENFDQTQTLDRIPAYESEIRRTAYTILMKRAGSARDFVTAADNRFDASTTILTARAEALLVAERMLKRVDNGFTVHTTAWTLTTPFTDNMPALFEACRTPLNIKVTVQNCCEQGAQALRLDLPINAMAAVTTVR